MQCLRVCAGVAAAAVVAAAACGKEAPTQPSDPPCATITITNNVSSPKHVTVAPGCRVAFTSNDAGRHEMVSDPHPEHTDCPPMNSVGVLNRGQSRQTGNLNTPGVCGFHDHERDQIEALRGTITIK
jgi:plastocyanin